MNKITIFSELLKTRNTDQISAFIQANPVVLTTLTEQGISGLLLLAYHQLPEVVAKAIALKESLTYHEAIACGSLAAVQKYINKSPALIHTFSPDGFPPLSLACYFGHEPIAQYLLNKGADIHAVATNGSQIQVLHAAVAKNAYDLCVSLLQKGAQVNAMQAQGVTPLHSAVHRGNVKIVQLLLKYGASLDAKMDNGDTPLSIAKREGHLEILLLLE